MPKHIGIDIGGTFTDIVIYDTDNKDISILKIASDSEHPELLISNALKSLNIDFSSINIINHASTVATNALLTHSGLPKTALITNKGFIDILEIGRQRRPEIYNLEFSRPVPLIQRKYRYGINARIDGNGNIIKEINRKELYGLKKKLKKENIESIAISFLNSYINPIHEKEVKEYLSKFFNHVFISSEIDPNYREYERTSTTVVNAVLSPIVSEYIKRMSNKFHEMGISSPFYVMNSNGGLNTKNYAIRFPISIIESGPAAGVIASLFLSKNMNLENIITFDMGGTTAKAGLITDGKPEISNEFEAAGKTHSGRSIKGSGYVVRYPFIDLAEVSAGGGTIAWVDDGRSLQVGPLSAGSNPGPAAYNMGGKDPTVTDANIILGRLNPEYLLSGEMRIYKDLSIHAMKKISAKLEMDEVNVSEGIIKIINNAMGRAISIVSIERGRDPRDYSMISFGGAGPLHACDLADEMGIREIIVPEYPGLFSAYGLLTVDITRIYSSSVNENNISSVFEELIKKASLEMKEENLTNFSIEKYVDVRYVGQSYEITIPADDYTKIKDIFQNEHKSMYGYSSNDPIEIVNAKLLVKVQVPKIELMKKKIGYNEIKKTERLVYIKNSFEKIPVYERETLSPGFKGNGPAIVEGYDSTVFVKDQWNFEVDEYKNLVLRR
ncbi:MAG: hydantoinase/oxoprolinase family protein [Thermoplasmata archaeon]